MVDIAAGNSVRLPCVVLCLQSVPIPSRSSKVTKTADHGSVDRLVCVRGDCARFQVVRGRTYVGVLRRR